MLLELKVCDPAMGSGHFLVNLVDYLADRVIEAMAEAEALVEGYLSPLVERIDGIRNTIMANAEDRGWTFDPAQLDDRHIVRRMVLKRCVYGVDKNPMAVELTKVSLWLHTFTVGAPLSFLDHHLRCGDSLFGTLGGARRPQDGGDEQSVPEGAARASHARGGAHADHRGADGCRDRRSASLRRHIRRNLGDDRSFGRLHVAASRVRLVGSSKTRGQSRVSELATGYVRQSDRHRPDGAVRLGGGRPPVT